MLALALALSSCRSGDETRSGHSYTPGFASPYRVAAVEKSWMARHKYDHERRLLVPFHNGTKWGAVQEYKQDGSIAFRDWWVRDVKVEDLEANPSTQVLAAERPEPAFAPEENLLGPATPAVSPTTNTLPPFGSAELATPTGPPLPEIPEVEPFAPALPSNPDGAPEIAPFDLSTTAPAGGDVAAPSPFAPIPGAMPSPALPGTAMPANPQPGAMPVPGGGQPMAPPAFPGPAPALPGGGDPLAPAPMVPPMPAQPGVPPAGPAVPAPANPFPPAAVPVPGVNPAPFPAPGGADPAVPVPPQGGGAPAPIEANPFAPLPGAQPAAPPVPAQPANPLGGGIAPMPVPAPNNANPIPAAPVAPVGGGKVPPPDPFGAAP